MKRATWLIVLSLAASSCGGGDSKSPSPTSPSPTTTTPTTPTRIINLTGTLSFGNVPVGSSVNQVFTIRNGGNSVLTITGMTGPCVGMFTTSFPSGSIQPGNDQSVTIAFAPTAAQDCSGVITVNGDQTSGTNTIPITATGFSSATLSVVLGPSCASVVQASGADVFLDGVLVGATRQGAPLVLTVSLGSHRIRARDKNGFLPERQITITTPVFTFTIDC